MRRILVAVCFDLFPVALPSLFGSSKCYKQVSSKLVFLEHILPMQWLLLFVVRAKENAPIHNRGVIKTAHDDTPKVGLAGGLGVLNCSLKSDRANDCHQRVPGKHSISVRKLHSHAVFVPTPAARASASRA
jgi:hypothetical protein